MKQRSVDELRSFLIGKRWSFFACGDSDGYGMTSKTRKIKGVMFYLIAGNHLGRPALAIIARPRAAHGA